MKMAWPEVDIGIGSERDGLISEIDCIKGIRSLPDAADTPIPSHGLGNKFDRKSALAYANILCTRNKFGDALVLYNIVLEKESKNLEALVGKGICLQAQHLNRQAFESFMEVINLDSQNACALTHCGVLYKDEGRLLEAAEKALKVDPSYRLAAECLAVVLTDIGTSLKLAGNTEAGIQKYCEALNVDNRYAVDLALSCYEKASIERPMYAEAYCNRGVIYKNRGDLETAIAFYERLIWLLVVMRRLP